MTESADDAPVPPTGEPRCRPHGNRLPCPRCLADEYGIYVWNNL